MEKTILSFFQERKTAWLKSRIKGSMSDMEKLAVESACDEKFSRDKWLVDAAKRAGQLSMVTHPGKFSHPSARVSAVMAKSERRADGYLRTGNCDSAMDTIGNAAALDVKAFLSLELSDGRTLLEHIEEGSDIAREELAISSSCFEALQEGFLAVKRNDTAVVTSGRIKQVYFPCDDDYHLLSILTPSGLMFELNERVRKMLFSDLVKEARAQQKKDVYSENGFDSIVNLSQIGYGGSKPQNISVLNNQNGGRAYLLPCLPPELIKRKVRLPRFNFFENSLRAGRFTSSFKELHKLLAGDYKNVNIRVGRDNLIGYIIDQVIQQMWGIRQMEAGWSQTDYYSLLPFHQKVWLDEINLEKRDSSAGWLNKVIDDFSRWIVLFYKKSLGKQAVSLGDAELRYIKSLIEQNREALK